MRARVPPASRACATAKGRSIFWSLLDAERTELQAEDAVAQSEADVFTSVVGLYKALGGIPARGGALTTTP